VEENLVEELEKAHERIVVLNKQFFKKLLELQEQFKSGQESQNVRAFTKMSSQIQANRRKSLNARDYNATSQIHMLVEYLKRRYDAVGLNVIGECRRVIEQGYVNSTAISFYFDEQLKDAIRALFQGVTHERATTEGT